jgi:site-specific DNA-methyltransferase (adenine-specific)
VIFIDSKIKLLNGDCLELMNDIPDKSVDVTLTDIPYDGVSRPSNGLRVLDKSKADILTFNLSDFLEEVYRITSGTIIIFCGQNQLSEIFNYFKVKNGTVRQLVWKKTNPSPMNGQYIYLSGVENAIWFKKRGGTFNAHCKNTVFEYSCGRSKFHPTEKNHNLLKELIIDNSKENDIVFDPCMGSGSTGVACANTNRQFIGIELDESYFNIAKDRIYNTVKGV